MSYCKRFERLDTRPRTADPDATRTLARNERRLPVKCRTRIPLALPTLTALQLWCERREQSGDDADRDRHDDRGGPNLLQSPRHHVRDGHRHGSVLHVSVALRVTQWPGSAKSWTNPGIPAGLRRGDCDRLRLRNSAGGCIARLAPSVAGRGSSDENQSNR
jgi:hypothetical protein